MAMTIVCESCGAKYRIGDDRVRGRLFKVRCKRCESVIICRGPEPAPDEADLSLQRDTVVVVAPTPDEPAMQPARSPEEAVQPWGSAGALERPRQAPSPSTLTAARHEQSVLFSLANIQALAVTSPHAPLSGPSAAPESGLIDIRALARSASAAREAEVGADVAGVPVSFTPSVLVPVAPRRSPALLPVVVALGSALALTLVTLAAVLILRPGQPPPPPPAPPAVTPAPAPRTPVTEPARAVAVAPPSPAAATVPSLSPPGRVVPRRAGQPRRLPRARQEQGRVVGPPAGPQRRSSERADRAAEDPLTRLINDAVGKERAGRESPAPRPRAQVARSLPEELTKQQIVAGMQGVRARVRECYDRYRVSGTAMLRVSIAPEGRVRAATVSGAFAGTPTGACLARAAAAARFPPFRGPAPLTIPEYPFILR